jgi:cytochrome b pre-mRNA-processing protein 3
MIPPLFRRPDPTIAALYGAIVAQARDARFYEAYGVADTVLGRFDMIMLHLLLLLQRLQQLRQLQQLQRLQQLQASDAALAQGLFDHFCRDMDHNLREMGVSDQGVPRQMRRVGEAFYGRAQAYESALAQPDDDALTEALSRNIYAGAEASVAAPRLAAYVRRAVAQLEEQPFEDLKRGTVRFPEPEGLAAAAE